MSFRPTESRDVLSRYSSDPSSEMASVVCKSSMQDEKCHACTLNIPRNRSVRCEDEGDAFAGKASKRKSWSALCLVDPSHQDIPGMVEERLARFVFYVSLEVVSIDCGYNY